MEYVKSYKILSTIKQSRKSGGPRTVLLITCISCKINTIKVRKSEIKSSSLKCKSCSHRKKPFESLYNSLMRDWRKLSNTLTYIEFLKFTKQQKCHYCLDKLNWAQYPTKNGKFIHRCYFLDRKDNNRGYSKTNCVVCCTKCNISKGNRYSYKEWFNMTKYFRNGKNNA